MNKRHLFMLLALILLSSSAFADGLKRRQANGSGGGGAAGAAGPAGGTFPSTYTIRMSYGGSILLSTNTGCPFPGACFWTGASTINIVDLQAAIVFGSTVGMTRFQLVESTGGAPVVPAQLSPVISRFPPIDVSTIVASGVTSISTVITTGVVVPANTWLGVQTTTVPVSGTMPQGFNILINAWKKPYGGT